MNTIPLIIIVSIGLLLFGIFDHLQRRQLRRAREKGLWPQRGQSPSIEDVKRLAKNGEQILAIRLYRQLHPASLRDAKDIVEKLASD
jgi:hypothetical protein